MRVGRIEIFPIKALGGLALEDRAITSGGILEGDRVYALFDTDGNVVSGKRSARIHELRAAFDPDVTEVSLWETGQSSKVQFHLGDRDAIGRWISDFLGDTVTLRHDPEKGFPDDRDAFGPTLVSDASLRVVNGWYPELTFESVRRRFRTNVELTSDEPFCEDRLFGNPGELLPFHVGRVRFLGHNPCQRCVVPTRDPDTSEATRGFQKSFAQLRQAHLPRWANAHRFNHFYRFALNTSVPPSEVGKRLRLGDEVTLSA